MTSIEGVVIGNKSRVDVWRCLGRVKVRRIDLENEKMRRREGGAECQG